MTNQHPQTLQFPSALRSILVSFSSFFFFFFGVTTIAVTVFSMLKGLFERDSKICGLQTMLRLREKKLSCYVCICRLHESGLPVTHIVEYVSRHLAVFLMTVETFIPQILPSLCSICLHLAVLSKPMKVWV